MYYKEKEFRKLFLDTQKAILEKISRSTLIHFSELKSPERSLRVEEEKSYIIAAKSFIKEDVDIEIEMEDGNILSFQYSNDEGVSLNKEANDFLFLLFSNYIL